MGSRPTGRGGILGGPIDDPDAQARELPAVAARTGTMVLHRPTRFLGELVAFDSGVVALRDGRGATRTFRNDSGAFAVDGRSVRLVDPTPIGPAGGEDRGGLSDGVRITNRKTPSGSRAVTGARARVARAGRILVEGVHDAALVEHVWGDDLRLEGVVVERLDGADHLAAFLAELHPAPGRRVGVLLDHLVPGTKEARLAAAVADPHVLVTGTPYVDVWQAVRPTAVGIPAWPEIRKGTDWKAGVCAALGFDEPRALWRHVLASVRDWTDLEQPLVRAVEQLIDFVTEGS